MVSFGGLLTIGGGEMICSSCYVSYLQPLGGLSTISRIINETALSQTEFAPRRMVFGGAIRSDGAALFHDLGLGALRIFSRRAI
jgi:hypothetical protein